MMKKYAFFLALILTLLLASNLYLIDKLTSKNKIVVKRAIDGDTLETSTGEILRLENINTPEKNKPGYNLAKEYLAQYENQSLTLVSSGPGKYGRTLAKLYDEEYINLKIVQEGLAKKFLVESSEKELFDVAEKEAIKNQKGLWKKSVHFGCIISKISEKDEIIELMNNCQDMKISNWIISDESRKEFKFSTVTFREIAIHSGLGENNETNYFLNSKTNIWNNDRDTLYIFDINNDLVHHHSYGYS